MKKEDQFDSDTMKKQSDYPQSSAINPGPGTTCLTGRHKPIHGDLTVAVQATGTRETGGPRPLLADEAEVYT